MLTSPSTGETTRTSDDGTDPDGSATGDPAIAPDGGSRPGANPRSGDKSSEPSPEARVRQALAANDGCLEQRDIADVTDMSQSTVSRTLITMEERGEVNRYEIGRGKTVFIPGREPKAFRSTVERQDSQQSMAP